MKTQIINSDGMVIETVPANGKDFSIQECQKIVGGYVEALASTDGNFFMVLNEEGKLNSLPPNNVATNIAHAAFNLRPGDYIVGDVLICSKSQFK